MHTTKVGEEYQFQMRTPNSGDSPYSDDNNNDDDQKANLVANSVDDNAEPRIKNWRMASPSDIVEITLNEVYDCSIFKSSRLVTIIACILLVGSSICLAFYSYSSVNAWHHIRPPVPMCRTSYECVKVRKTFCCFIYFFLIQGLTQTQKKEFVIISYIVWEPPPVWDISDYNREFGILHAPHINITQVYIIVSLFFFCIVCSNSAALRPIFHI